MNCATCAGAGMGQCTQCVVGSILSDGMCSKMVQASVANTGGSGLGLGVIIGAAVGGVLFLLLLLLCLLCLLLPILRRRREEKRKEPPPSQELVKPPQEPEVASFPCILIITNDSINFMIAVIKTEQWALSS
jgi:hypothetical protein